MRTRLCVKHLLLLCVLIKDQTFNLLSHFGYYGDLLKIKIVIMRTCLNTLKENVTHVVLKK